MECFFIESPFQKITTSKEDKTHIYIKHDDWYVAIPKLDILTKKSAPLLSPISYLYVFYRQNPSDTTLWLFEGQELFVGIIFSKNRPLFYKIAPKGSLQHFVEEMLHHFYKEPYSYFIEKIVLFGSEAKDPKELQELLLLPVEVRSFSCDTTLLAPFFIQQKRNSLRYLLLTLGFFVIFVGLAEGYLHWSLQTLEEKKIALKERKKELNVLINTLQQRIDKIQEVQSTLQHIKEHNMVLIAQIKNIFDLIPDSIYLTRADFNENALILEGVAKSKKEFLQKVHTHLTTIYDRSKVYYRKRGKRIFFRAVYQEGNR